MTADQDASTLSPAGVRRSRGSRLTAEDWAVAGLDVLLRDGIRGVTINNLCGYLGVTRGSFYWHFDDLGALHAAMAGHWCTQTRAAFTELAALSELPPADLLRTMTTRLIDESTWGVERALREWARTDEQVAQLIADADTFTFGLVQNALLKLGWSEERAVILTGVLMYAGIGFAQGQSTLPVPTVGQVDVLLTLLAEPT